MIASEKFAQYAQYAMQGMQLLFLSFSREDEREADRLGVEYSSKVDFDAHKMADFFKVLQKMSLAQNQGGIPTFLSTHPDPGDRYVYVNEKATEWQTKLKFPEYKVNQDGYLKMIDGIVYGEDPRQGYVDGNVFYHPDLKFRFSIPAGWKLENSPIQVTMGPSDGKAMVLFTLCPQRTLAEAADSTIRNLGLTLTGSRKATVNGLPAIVTQSKQVTQDQSTGVSQTNLVLSYFINLDNRFYVFHGVSAESDFPVYSRMFEPAMASFARLSDLSKINVKPKKIHVVKVQRTGTMADALRAQGVPQAQFNELSLLNDTELTAQVPAGKLIKVIGE
jgi:predicted Zn-dependent protease